MNRVYDVCQEPGCHNPPWKRGAKFCAEYRQRKREENNHRNRPLSKALCEYPGCTNVHHGRSGYCVEHVKRQRGTQANLAAQSNLQLARHMLHAQDLPQRLTPYQRVTVMDVRTFKW